MGRQKITRECSFKPLFRHFGPLSKFQNGVMELNCDEMEAIFLMDYQGLYQEDAAVQMNISRPTLSRIIKSARQKIATALIRGYALNIIEAKDKFIVAFPTNDTQNFSSFLTTEPFIALVHIYNQNVLNVHFVSNPLQDEKSKTPETLALFLKKHEVRYWLSSDSDEALKNALLSKSIFVDALVALKSVQDIPHLFCLK